MQNHAAGREEIDSWKRTFAEYRDRLVPNRKSGEELFAYLESRYRLTPPEGGRAEQTVVLNILENECFARELPSGAAPDPVCRIVEPDGAGDALYRAQDELYSGCKILVGIDLVSGYFSVEGSGLLWDELCAYRGLNENDLKNYYSVAEYIACLRRFGLLEQTLERLPTGRDVAKMDR